MNKKIIWGIIIAIVIIVGVFVPIYKGRVVCGINPEKGCWNDRVNLINYIKNVKSSKINQNDVISISDWKTYTNEKYGFEFKYDEEKELSGSINDHDILALGYDDKNTQSGAHVFVSIYEGENFTPPISSESYLIGSNKVYYSSSPFAGWRSSRTSILYLVKNNINVVFAISFMSITNDFDVKKTKVFKEVEKMISTLKFTK